jgi:hypothetical protein
VQDLSGKTFNFLKVIKFSHKIKTGKNFKYFYLCLCLRCNKETTVRSDRIIDGRAKSCGCLRSVDRKDYDDDVRERLLNSIKIDENGCWIWQKSIGRGGYGKTYYKGKCYTAHRLSYKIFKGKIPKSMQVCHTCDVRKCVNPDHLWLGTAKDNMQDCVAKNRHVAPTGLKNHFTKLSENEVLEIRKLFKEGVRIYKLVKLFKVTDTTISAIIKNKTWKHIGEIK